MDRWSGRGQMIAFLLSTNPLLASLSSSPLLRLLQQHNRETADWLQDMDRRLERDAAHLNTVLDRAIQRGGSIETFAVPALFLCLSLICPRVFPLQQLSKERDQAESIATVVDQATAEAILQAPNVEAASAALRGMQATSVVDLRKVAERGEGERDKGRVGGNGGDNGGEKRGGKEDVDGERRDGEKGPLVECLEMFTRAQGLEKRFHAVDGATDRLFSLSLRICHFPLSPHPHSFPPPLFPLPSPLPPRPSPPTSPADLSAARQGGGSEAVHTEEAAFTAPLSPFPLPPSPSPNLISPPITSPADLSTIQQGGGSEAVHTGVTEGAGWVLPTAEGMDAAQPSVSTIRQGGGGAAVHAGPTQGIGRVPPAAEGLWQWDREVAVRQFMLGRLKELDGYRPLLKDLRITAAQANATAAAMDAKNCELFVGLNKRAGLWRGVAWRGVAIDDKNRELFVGLNKRAGLWLGMVGYRTDNMTNLAAPTTSKIVKFWADLAREEDGVESRKRRDPETGVGMHFTGLVTGLPLVVRRNVLRRLGGLDEADDREGEAAIVSDWQLATRVWLSGYQVSHFRGVFHSFVGIKEGWVEVHRRVGDGVTPGGAEECADVTGWAG
ncbi:unnamed protein product [Closterium sp. NIES-54]